MSESAPGVTPPPPGTPPIPVTPTSDNPAGAATPTPPPGSTTPGAYAPGPSAYGAPPAPPAPRPPNPFVENLKADLLGTFPAPTDAPQGKLWAILCYFPGVFIPLWLVPLVRRTNHLSLFHAKQMLAFAAIEAPGLVVFGLLSVLIRKIPTAGFVLSIIATVMVGLTLLAVAAIGLLGAVRGQVKPLPLIGRLGDRVLRSLTVCPPTPHAEPQLAYWMRVAPPARIPQASSASPSSAPPPSPQQAWSPPPPPPPPPAGATPPAPSA